MLLLTAWICCVFAGVTLLFCGVNRFLFLRAPVIDSRQPAGSRRRVSVLIPARNEEHGIRSSVERVLAQQGVDLEVIVLDDHSTDRTRDVVQLLAQQDKRLTLLGGGALPAGWCGKQFACQQLADAASCEDLVFMDADVHLQPDAIARAVDLRHQMRLDLLSGFPHQRAETPGERLLIPLINYILVCYLPFPAMRGSTSRSACAGCGQLFLTSRASYRLMGGHAAIRGSLHDGVMLPRAYRQVGLMTDVFDASDVAQVRMYHGFAETWQGLSKNAGEGFANSRLIVPSTFLLAGAHVVPFLLMTLLWFRSEASSALPVAAAAATLSLLSRTAVAAWFDRQWLLVPLHPFAIALFLLIQWSAWMRTLRGGVSEWRGRAYSPLGELSS